MIRQSALLGIGILASLLGAALGLPGRGEWIAACWVGGALVALVAPTLGALAIAIAGIALATFGLVLLAGQVPDLAGFVVAAEAAVLAHGFLVGACLGRAWRRRSLSDPRVIAGLLLAAGLVIVARSIAEDLARNPL